MVFLELQPLSLPSPNQEIKLENASQEIEAPEHIEPAPTEILHNTTQTEATPENTTEPSTPENRCTFSQETVVLEGKYKTFLSKPFTFLIAY